MVPQGRSHLLTAMRTRYTDSVPGHDHRHPDPAELNHVLAFDPCHHRFDQHRRKFKPDIAIAIDSLY